MVYLLYEINRLKQMTIAEVRKAREDFVAVAQATGKEYTYDMLGVDDGKLYRVGVIFDGSSAMDTIIPVPENDRGLFGVCLDLSRAGTIDRVTLLKGGMEK